MKTLSIIAATLLAIAARGALAQERAEVQAAFDGDSIPSLACPDGNVDAECVIELKVEDWGSDSCRISLMVPTQDLVSFTKGFKDKFVYWKIKDQPAGKPYRFGLGDGITFVDDPRPRSFVSLRRGSKDPTVFRAKNKLTRVSVFKYVVNVTNETEDTAPTRECALDPWFRNR